MRARYSVLISFLLPVLIRSLLLARPGLSLKVCAASHNALAVFYLCFYLIISTHALAAARYSPEYLERVLALHLVGFERRENLNSFYVISDRLEEVIVKLTRVSIRRSRLLLSEVNQISWYSSSPVLRKIPRRLSLGDSRPSAGGCE